MLPKRLLAITLGAALAAMGGRDVRAQWVPVGPEGGSILKLTAMGRYIFAGTSGGTLYRSSNDGASWSRVLGTTNTDIDGIAIRDSIIFVASDSVYFSTDSGLTWTGLTNPDAHFYKQDPLAVLGRYLILGSNGVLYRTSDQGATWETIGQADVRCLMVKGSDIYVGSGISAGLSRSTDSGKTWTDIGIVDSINDRVQSLAFEGNNIFAGSYFFDKIYRSIDNGITWDTLSVGLPPIGNEGPNKVITSLFQDSTILFAGTVFGLFRSLDSGTSWTKVSSMKVQSFLRSGNYILAGTALDGIVRTTDYGLHWTSSNTGIDNLPVTAFASIGSHLFVGVDEQGVYRSDDSGKTFTPANNGIDSLSVATLVPIGTTLCAFSVERPCYASTDLGITWASRGDTISEIATAIGSCLIAIDKLGQIVISTDTGNHWVTRGTGSSSFEVVCLISHGTELYAPWREYETGGDILHSTDSGATWSGLGFGGNNYSFAVDNDYLFAGTGPGYLSFGEGFWRKKISDSQWLRPSNFPDASIGSFAVSSIVSSHQDVFLSTDEGIDQLGQEGIGVFHSSDYGDTWSAINEGLKALIVPQLFIFPPYIFAGTLSASVWRRPLSDFGISAVSEPQPVAVTIRNYPNPFSQSTTISFNSETAGYADVTIVNPLGTEVARLFSGELAPGAHQFQWRDPAAPDGMYGCVVRMNGRVEQAGMVRMR